MNGWGHHFQIRRPWGLALVSLGMTLATASAFEPPLPAVINNVSVSNGSFCFPIADTYGVQYVTDLTSQNWLPLPRTGSNWVCDPIVTNANRFYRLSRDGGGFSLAGNVYSVNSVGYINRTFGAGTNYLANPFYTLTNNTLGEVLPVVPDGTVIYKPDTVRWASSVYRSGQGWLDGVSHAPSTMTLRPGEGAVMVNPAPVNVTFFGEVPQGYLAKCLPVGLSLISCPAPRSGRITSDLEFPAVLDDILILFDPVSRVFRYYYYDGFDWWSETSPFEPVEPVIAIGQPFWLWTDAARNWVLGFFANQFLGGCGNTTPTLPPCSVPWTPDFGATGEPAILVQPVSQTLPAGTNVTFTVDACGAPPLSFRWRFNGVPITSATNSHYSRVGLVSTNAGGYSVVVSNAFGVVTSVVATLTVNTPPPPAPHITNIQVLGGTVTFTFTTVTGSRYQVQYKNDLASAEWTLLTGLISGTGTLVSISDSVGANPSRFYRVVDSDHALYSSNVVGYANITVSPPWNLIANPFRFSDSNRVQDVIGAYSLPEDSLMLKVRPPGFECASFYSGEWLDCDTGDPTMMTLSPGEGSLLYTEAFAATITFVGEVLQGTLTNKLSAGLSLFSSVVPQSGLVASWLGFPAEASDVFYKFHHPSQSYLAHTYLGFGAWDPVEPVISVGEAFWVELGSPREWVRQFSAEGSGGGTYTVTNLPYFGPPDALVPGRTPPQIVAQPQSRTNLAGTDATFSVSASGSPWLHYQWRLGTAAIPGATNATLILPNVQATDAGAYRVVITNAFGSLTSAPANLTVTQPPSAPFLHLQSAGNAVSVCWTQSALGYQLQQATVLTGPWANVAAAPIASGGMYCVTAALSDASRFYRLHAPGGPFAYSSNVVGYVNLSIAGNINVIGNPFQRGQNRLRDVLPQAPGWMSISKVGMSGLDCSYFDGMDWRDCDTDQLSSMTLSPGEGAILESETPAAITFLGDVLEGALTHKLPAGLSLCSSIVPLTATITGLGFPAEVGDTIYQFDRLSQSYRVHTCLGAGNWEPAEPVISVAEGFWVELGRAKDWVTHFSVSEPKASAYTVTNRPYVGDADPPVPPPREPIILVQPQSRTNVADSDASFGVIASGTPPLRYQWKSSGVAIPGATNSTLIVSNVQLTTSTNFQVIISNNWGSATSQVATLTVTERPAIIVQPQSRTNTVATDASFSVVASGTAPLNYQWTLNGANLPGANGTNLFLPKVQHGNAGIYWVVVSSPWGSVTSAPAVLVVSNYCLQVQVLSATNAMGSEVMFSVRSYDCVTGNNIANVPAVLWIRTSGISRSIPVPTTGGAGQTNVAFQPFPSEAGSYQYAASLPGADPPPGDEFVIIGMAFNETEFSHRLRVGVPNTNRIGYRNVTTVALGGLTAEVVGAPVNLLVEVNLPGGQDLEGLATNELIYTVISLSDNPPQASFIIRLSSDEGASAELEVSVNIAPPVPQLVATPPSLRRSMVRGEQAVVGLELANVGGAPATNIDIYLPPVPWLTLISTPRIASLGMDETNTITLLLSPPADLPLQEYASHILFYAGETELRVPFAFQNVSARQGALRVMVVNESTYNPPGGPNVTNAAVTLTESRTGATVASGVSDASGTLLLTNLAEGIYDVHVSADKHDALSAMLRVLPDQTNEVVYFISQNGVTFSWKVIPSLDPDHYRIDLEAVFETVVPWPNLTIQPAGLNLCGYGAGETQVMLTISNHSLINAESLELFFPPHPAWSIRPLVTTLPDLGPGSSMEVPLLIQQTAPNGNVPSRMDGRLRFQFSGEGIIFRRSVPIPVWNANVWDCTNAPLVTLTPREIDMCSFESGTNWTNFTIRNLAALPIDNLNLTFDSHVHWRIEPSSTNLGSLGPHTSIVVAVQFIKTSSAVSGRSAIQGRLTFDATLENETRRFVRKTVLNNPNPWDCVGAPLSIRPNNINLCAFTSDTNVPFTITNHSRSNANDLKLEFGTHPRWRIQPSVSQLGPLGPTSSVVVSVLFEKVPTNAVGPPSIPAHLNYHATLEGEMRSFSPEIALRNANPWNCHPNPPVTIDPPYIDLCRFSGSRTVTFNIHNRSSITVTGATIQFGTHPRWRIQSPVTNLPALSPGMNYPLAVDFIEINRTNRGSSYIDARFDYQATADNQTCDFPTPIPIYNANLSDCLYFPPPPPPPGGGGGGDYVYKYLFVKGTLLFQQVITVRRNTFTATLGIFNGSGLLLTNLAVDIEVLNMLKQPATDRFGIRVKSMKGVSDVSGSGAIETNSEAVIEWTLIPAADAFTNGPQYTVGGTVHYSLNGTPFEAELYPVPITVLPDPQLYFDYFWERIAFSDDAQTGEIEPAVPFAVGMIMRNEGMGTARSIQIETAKPKVKENESGLLIAFNLVRAQVGNQQVLPDLKLNLGDLAPNQVTQAIWWLTSSLQAEFIEYDATFSHLDAIGERNLSLIPTNGVQIHALIHVVRDDRPGADDLQDFLAMDPPTNAPALPNRLYFSDGSVSSNVVSITNATVDGFASVNRPMVILTNPVAPQVPAGWAYLRARDPGNGARLVSVERPDGRRLLDDNFWTTHRIVYPRDGAKAYPEDFLHLFDYDPTNRYTLHYNVDLNITRQPQDLLCFPAGSNAVFRVQVGGAGPFTYQWYRSETNLSGTDLLSGETNAALTIANVQTNNAGYYSVRVSNVVGDSLGSGSAVLTVCVPPMITAQPQCRTNIVGQTATFSVTATGTLPLAYQWFKDEVVLPDETNATLVIANAQTNHAGEYRAKIENVAGNKNSAAACLVVLEPLCLVAVSNRTVVVDRQLIITNLACDTNRSLTFALCAGPGTITPEGVYRWTPACSDGSSTNLVCIRAIDDAYPILSNSVTFLVQVPECIQAGLGNTIMLAGTTSSVPVRLLSTTALTNMCFIVSFPPERFDTNFALNVNSPQVLTQNWSLVELGQIKLCFTLPATNILYGPTNVGNLSFTAVSNQSSAFVSLLIADVNGLKPDGQIVANAFGLPGRVIIIGREPLLEAEHGTNSHPILTLYGNPGISYMLQTATNLSTPVLWSNAFPVLVPLTNLFESFVWTNRHEPTRFFRATGP